MPNDLILYGRQGVEGTFDVSNPAVRRRDALITSQLPRERKLGGILTETKVQQGRITKAVVGVGINWANPVPESGINLQSLQETQLGATIASLEMLTAVTLIGIASGHQRSQVGIDTLLLDYEKLLINIGRSVCVDGYFGVIVGVTAIGDLRVRLGMNDVDSVASPEIYLKPGTISLGYS